MPGRGHGADRNTGVIRRDRDIRRDHRVVDVALRWAGGCVAVCNCDRVRGARVVYHIGRGSDDRTEEWRSIDSLREVSRCTPVEVIVATVYGIDLIMRPDRER